MDLRLYLDTADLITIGDGRDQVETAAKLISECDRTGTVLMCSMWHLADVRNAAADGRERLYAAIDRFPMRMLAMLDAQGGFVTWTVPSIAALVQEHGDDIDALHRMTNYAVGLFQSVERPVHQDTWEMNLLKRAMIEALKAGTEAEAYEIFRNVLRKRRDFPADRIESALTGVSTMWEVRRRMEQVGPWDPNIVVEALTVRKTSEVPEHSSVGAHLGVLADQRRNKQIHRAVQAGDLADRNHLGFAPHVDIFTGDKDMCAWLDEWRPKHEYERDVVAINSQRLRDVVAVLETYETV